MLLHIITHAGMSRRSRRLCQKPAPLIGSTTADWMACGLLCNMIDVWAGQQLYWTKGLPLAAEGAWQQPPVPNRALCTLVLSRQRRHIPGSRCLGPEGAGQNLRPWEQTVSGLL